MQADAMTMGELGKTKTQKPKKPKAPKTPKVVSRQPITELRLTQPTAPSIPFINTYDPPPPVVSRAPVQTVSQPGQGKFSRITDLISQGLQSVTAWKTAGAQPGYAPTDYSAGDPGAPGGASNAGKRIGEGVGGAVDSFGKAVAENPLLFGGLLLGGVLLFMSPPSRRR